MDGHSVEGVYGGNHHCNEEFDGEPRCHGDMHGAFRGSGISYIAHLHLNGRNTLAVQRKSVRLFLLVRDWSHVCVFLYNEGSSLGSGMRSYCFLIFVYSCVQKSSIHFPRNMCSNKWCTSPNKTTLARTMMRGNSMAVSLFLFFFQKNALKYLFI